MNWASKNTSKSRPPGVAGFLGDFTLKDDVRGQAEKKLHQVVPASANLRGQVEKLLGHPVPESAIQRAIVALLAREVKADLVDTSASGAPEKSVVSGKAEPKSRLRHPQRRVKQPKREPEERAMPDVAPSEAAPPVPERTDIRRQLQERAAKAILTGTTWLTTKEVGERATPNATNKYAFASRLLKQRRVFAIDVHGAMKFPDYAFDAFGQTIPEMKEVLAVLADYGPFRIASWFESTSSMLGGKRPREVISEQPKAVVEAARQHVQGPQHG
ncbi:MAG: hypothetical protein ABWY05_04350 [Noviherbaspirillum sp.]